MFWTFPLNSPQPCLLWCSECGGLVSHVEHSLTVHCFPRLHGGGMRLSFALSSVSSAVCPSRHTVAFGLGILVGPGFRIAGTWRVEIETCQQESFLISYSHKTGFLLGPAIFFIYWTHVRWVRSLVRASTHGAQSDRNHILEYGNWYEQNMQVKDATMCGPSCRIRMCSLNI